MNKKREITLPLLLAKSLTLVLMCTLLLFLWDASAEKSKAKEQMKKETANEQKAAKKETAAVQTAAKKIPVKKHSETKNTVIKQPAKMVSPGDADTIYLTFDDGPTRTTGKLLDLLEKHHVKASFFMLEPGIKKYQDEVKRIDKDGHSLGLHGVSHSPKLFYRSPETVTGEMKTAQAALRSVTGVRSSLVRTPYGSKPLLTAAEKKALTASGFIYWDWNVDSDDWKYKDKNVANEVYKQIERQKKNFPRQPIVVLMHDRAGSLSSVDTLLTKLKNKGYQFKTVNEHLKPVQFR
ncbi:polysaccharide deacetylase [Metabacillus sp. GX 13764]|uniref:polysaccharide deacetylase family protein n=1 Tax=Metabacillus kandeliae TaxID=2900151 RepID=UPI001E406E63|nr:polysaccharide deacetylase family protein [Metabacillus kandeliae]MCD7034794.1 polysaccharide deacetylase [Metabacillus kandeliae]